MMEKTFTVDGRPISPAEVIRMVGDFILGDKPKIIKTKPSFKGYKDFWKRCNKKGKVAAFMTIEDLREWTEIVFKAARSMKICK